MEAHELMSIEQFLNAIGLSGALFCFFTPTIIVCLVVYGIRRIKRKNKIKQEQAHKVKEAQEALQKQQKINKSSSKKAQGLALEFDENGEIKK